MRPQSSAFRPQTYKDWLNEVNFSSKPQEMVQAGLMAGKLAPNKQTAQHDLALVLAEKYRQEVQRARGNSMVVKSIKAKFDEVARDLFKSKFSSMLNYVMQNEPSFDPQASRAAKGVALGFIGAKTTRDSDGRVRNPLGFIKKPSGKGAGGKAAPGLGFLEEDNSTNGSLGFL